MLRFCGIAFFILILSCTSPATVEEKPTQDPLEMFRGRWRLHRMLEQDSAGTWSVPERLQGRNGYILYDGLGGMGVHHVPAGFSDYSLTVNGPVDSLSRADLEHLAGQLVYFGRYSVDTARRIITHHRETNFHPHFWNTSVERRYSFRGDTLVLEPIGSPMHIVWIRIDEQKTQFENP